LKIVDFKDLHDCDLVIDAIYKGSEGSSIGNEPLHRLLSCGTMGCFRYVGSRNIPLLKYVVLYSSQIEPDWPDHLDTKTGYFTYYGDNREPGHQLEDTPKKGNQVLRDCFNALHTGNREIIPPFFIFSKGPLGRDVVYHLLEKGVLHTPSY